MKKALLSVTLLASVLFGITSVNAEEISLDEIDTHSLIIGERVYELNEYYLSMYDIVSATSEYVQKHDKSAPIYYLGELNGSKYLREYVGAYNPETGIIPQETRDITKIYPGNKMEATAINSVPTYDYVAKDIEPQVKAAVEQLNTTAQSRGFESITYANKKVTFTIADLTKSLADYKDSGIVDLFLSVLGDAKSATYTVGETTVTEDLTGATNAAVISMAKDLLELLSGDGDLTYNSIANKSVTAIVTFEYDGFEYEQPYTVEFIYDVEKVKDEALKEVAAELNKTASTYGFESITYANKTATFTIADVTKSLANYKESGIVDYFIKNVEGATKATYTIGGVTKEKDLTGATNASVVAMAKELLELLVGDGDLTLGSVANKSVTADVTYVIGGETKVVPYTLSFVYDVEKVKDEALKGVAAELNKTASTYGFESITYANKTATFTIADVTKSLANYKESGIVDYFIKNVEGATKATYTIGGVTKEKDLTGATNASVVAMAKELLELLVGDGDLTLGSVANKSVTADVTYVIGGVTKVVPYTLSFIYDVDKAKDTDLTNVATELNKTASTYGFESIVYNEVTNTATFTIADVTKSLVDYKESGIVDYFIENVEGATKATYTIGEVTKEKNLTSVTNAGVVAMAKELLELLVGDGDLTLGSVAGKSVTANITFVVDGVEKVVPYTLSFVMSE